MTAVLGRSGTPSETGLDRGFVAVLVGRKLTLTLFSGPSDPAPIFWTMNGKAI